MQTKYYTCRFLSDIVLPASSNTQGNITPLDFIPGSNFLGMAAASYDAFGEAAFDVFHAGAVRFGDAHLLIDGKESYKIPLSFHRLKVGEGYYNRIHLDDDEERELRHERKQLKQIRSGFMNEDLRYVEPSYDYTQKSAYDRALRRSKDSTMFGYNALRSDTQWLFSITYDDDRHIEAVEAAILGEKRLGRSRSAQYGRVEIRSAETPKPLPRFEPEGHLAYLYAQSRLLLTDEEGVPTLTPSGAHFGVPEAQVLWEKSQIRSGEYLPYNARRQSKEYSRLYIDKGSVIVLEGVNDPSAIPETVGAFQAEGFGKVLVNPAFLKEKMPTLTPYEAPSPTRETPPEAQGALARYARRCESQERVKFDTAAQVQACYADLIGPSKSQWGEIRAIASVTPDKNRLKEKIEDYIGRGVAKKQWEGKQKRLLQEIDKAQDAQAFVKLLAMITAKHTRGGKDGQ